MNQNQLEEIVTKVIDNLKSKDFSQDEFMERVKEHSNENGKLDLYQLTGLILHESRLYSELLLFDVLNELRDKGVIVLPNTSAESSTEKD